MMITVSLRLLYLIFDTICGWLVLPGPSTASKDIELLVLRHEVALLRPTKPKPRLDCADRAVIATLIRLLPEVCGCTGWSPLGTVALPPGNGPTRTGRDARRSTPRSPRSSSTLLAEGR
jgi:hypothetical protein